MSDVASRARRAVADARPIGEFYFNSRYGERRGDPDVADFTFGNPHEMPLPGFVAALQAATPPRDKNWFAYKTSEPEPRAFLAKALRDEIGLSVEPDDLALTSGAFAAIAVAFHMLLEPDDEVIFSEPAWFSYLPMLRLTGATPRPVDLTRPEFDLDLAAIERAMSPKTRLVIVNTPHNPTGRIVPEATLRALASLLEDASARNGRRIYLLADEPYRRLRFDGHGFTTPAAVYPWSLVSYSYGKVLLTPGQRLGYLMISPLMPDEERHEFREALFPVQMALGWCFPNAIMQAALPDLERLSIDIDALARRRDALSPVLTDAGCSVLEPEGTFYLWSRWPDGDPAVLWDRLADEGVFVLPGTTMGVPDYFRISLTASDAMVARALPAFAALGRN